MQQTHRLFLYSFFIICAICAIIGLVIGRGTIGDSEQIQATPPKQIVNIYSYRQPFLIQPLFDAFTQQTGIEVKTVFASKGLIERVSLEGARSPVDVVLTKNFHHLEKAGKTIAQPVSSKILTQHIPIALRGENNKWFGLTQRARVLFVSRDRVKEKHIHYESLASPKWKGRLCMRSGQHPYNLSLFAAMQTHYGKAWTREWLKGVKANLVSKPAGNDRAQIKQIYAGKCDIALANTYYMGKMTTNEKIPEQKKWALSVRLIFPTGVDFGTHVNVSGMVMAKYAPHPEAARQFMEFMVSKNAQKIYAETNYEYPARAGVEIAPLVASWGQLEADTTPLTSITKNYEKVSFLLDEVDFNN